MAKLKIKKNNSFEDLKNRFKIWRFNVYLCFFIYVIFFLVFKKFIMVESVINPISSYSEGNGDLVSFLAGIFLGFLFILDSIISSYLKTPLQRLATKIEISDISEVDKNILLKNTQESNELFKETFKKFGILVIPSFVIKVIDSTPESVSRIIQENKRKLSENPLFYSCYLIPIAYASYKIWYVSKKLDDKIKEMGSIY